MFSTARKKHADLIVCYLKWRFLKGMNYAVELKDVSKTFNGKPVICNSNMHVKKGEIYGFVGPKGA